MEKAASSGKKFKLCNGTAEHGYDCKAMDWHSNEMTGKAVEMKSIAMLRKEMKRQGVD